MKINHFFILLVMFVLLVSACTPATSTPQPDQVELAKIACQSTGGSPVVPANAADPASVKCIFQDGSNCDGLALLAGTCTQVSASTGQAAPSPTPYPTKEQGVGDINVRGQDASEPQVVLRNVSNPEEVYNVLRKAWMDARKRYGLQFREYM